MIGEATYIACRHKQQLLPSTKQELPAWIYVRGKVQFKSMCCLEGIECVLILSTGRIRTARSAVQAKLSKAVSTQI